MPRKWTASICARPLVVGGPTKTRLVSLPGRVNAGSSASGLFVAAKTNTPAALLNPSISTSIWFNVWSRSSFNPAPRRAPMASSSSMNTTHGAFFRASAKSSRTRAAPRPTKSSTNSEAATGKKATPASPATARASKVFPVPGGPTNRHPAGSL